MEFGGSLQLCMVSTSTSFLSGELLGKEFCCSILRGWKGRQETARMSLPFQLERTPQLGS